MSSIPPPGNMPYAILDAQNNVLAVSWMPFQQFYNSPPAGSIAISVSALQQMLSAPGQYIYQPLDGSFSLPPNGPIISSIQEAACAQVDTAAETCRGQFITSGIGQMLVYEAKYQEASKFLNLYPTDAAATAANINPNLWPLLQAELDITGSDLWNVACVINELQTAWTVIAAMIEQLRLGTKAAINEATTPAQVSALVIGCVFPIAGDPAEIKAETSSMNFSGGSPKLAFSIFPSTKSVNLAGIAPVIN